MAQLYCKSVYFHMLFISLAFVKNWNFAAEIQYNSIIWNSRKKPEKIHGPKIFFHVPNAK